MPKRERAPQFSIGDLDELIYDIWVCTYKQRRAERDNPEDQRPFTTLVNQLRALSPTEEIVVAYNRFAKACLELGRNIEIMRPGLGQVSI